MKLLPLAAFTLVVVAVFVGVGYGVNVLVVRHAALAGTPVAEVRLAAWMAGLFAGGAAAVVVLIAMLMVRR